MILIIGGERDHRRALQHILRRGPVPTCICEQPSDVDAASRAGPEPVSLILYDVEVATAGDLDFLRDVREGKYEMIRSGVPVLILFRTMSGALMKEAHAHDAITVEKPAEAGAPIQADRKRSAGWAQKADFPRTFH